MKKLRILEIHFQDFRDFQKQVTSALKKRKRMVQPKHKIYFESVETFRGFMTMQKVEILTVIYNCEPKTIYGLAKLVGRDFAAVFRDCMGLKTTGFIDLVDSGDAKSSKKPVLSFPYNCISVSLPRSPYQIAFKEAA